MKNPTIQGTFKLKISAVGLHGHQNIGMSDAAIIHKLLDKFQAGIDPMYRGKLTFEDCKIIEGKESVLPF